MIIKKDMSLGSKKIKLLLITLFTTLFVNNSFSEDRITTSPLINLEKIKPSFEESDENENFNTIQNIKKKRK